MKELFNFNIVTAMKTLFKKFINKIYQTNHIATLAEGNRAQRRAAKRMIKKL